MLTTVRTIQRVTLDTQGSNRGGRPPSDCHHHLLYTAAAFCSAKLVLGSCRRGAILYCSMVGRCPQWTGICWECDWGGGGM